MAIPSNYQKYTIAWGGGTSGNLYIWINPSGGNQTVYVTSDENMVESSRTKVVTFRTTVPGLSTSAQSVAQLTVKQNAAVYEYILTITTSKTSLAAYADNTTISATLETIRNSVSQGKVSVTPTYSFSGTHTGFSISGSTVSAEDRHIIVGSARSCKVYATYNVSGKTITSNTLTITQAANTKTIDGLTLTGVASSGTISTIPYTGGTVTWTTKAMESYTSGSEQTVDVSTSASYSVVVESGLGGATQNGRVTAWALNTGDTNRQAMVTVTYGGQKTYNFTTQLKDNFISAQYTSVVGTYSDVKSVWD